MKKILLPSFALMASLLSVQAQLFTNGNLTVVRVGGAGQSVSTNGIAVHVDQYSTNGSLINSLDLPTNGANAFVLDSSTAEGFMTVSGNNQYLVLAGYNAPVGGGFGTSFGLNGTTSTAISRSIATVDGYGNYVLQITNNLAYTTWPITAAAFDGTSNFWMLGENSTNQFLGLIYAGTHSSPATVVIGNTGGEETGMNLYNGALFISSSFSPNGIYQILNTNTPVAPLPMSTNFANPIIPLPSASRIKDFVFDPGMTTCYYADTSIGIVKFTNNAGTWVSNYTIAATNAGGFTTKGALALTADWTQNPVVVYATTAETSGNRLIQVIDSGASAVPILLAQAFTNHVDTTNVFRGVRFAPQSAPFISSQPASVAQSADGSATFTVSPQGTPPFAYQWYMNGTAVSGATSASFTINNVTTFQNGTPVYVVVTNSFGTATSSNAILTVTPNYFTAGNLAVVQLGSATVPVASTGEPVSIVQFTTNGTQVSTVPLPSTGPNAFILDNSSTEGFVSLSANNQYLVLGGYNTNVQTTGLAATTSTNVFRAVATVDGYGNYALPITNGNIYSTANIRGAAEDALGNFFVSGSGGAGGTIANGEIGIIYVGNPPLETNVTVTETGTGNERVLNIYNNTLYLSTGSGSGTFGRGIYMVSNSVSGGIPTNTGSLLNNTNIMQTGATSSSYDFVINSTNTIAYVADQALGGIIKFTSTGPGGLWVSNYTISVFTTGAAASGTNAQGVTADFTKNPPVIYATTTESTADRLVQVVDNGASSTATLLATAPAGTAYRGVRFVPGVPPTITTQPSPFTQDAGGSATFTVVASGTPALGYQWYTNGVAISGATFSNLTLTSLTTAQNGFLVSAVVSNNFGTTTSSNALLTVQPPGAPLNVTITSPNQTVNAGSAAVINVSAVGTSLTYFWSLNGVTLSDGASVSGSSTASLTISPAYATYNGTYTVTASNSFGKVAANNSVTLKVIDPVILVQPVGSTNLPNTSANLSVSAAGAPPLTYQWSSNGVAIASATTSSLSFVNTGTISSGSYTVVVSNNLGNSITSAPTVISFTPFLLNDTFTYANGNLFGDPGSPWTDINGTNPELVIGGRVQVAQTNFTTDAQSLFTRPVSNTVVWSSFIINLSTSPTNAGGSYFANIEDTNFGFYGRIFTLTTNQAAFTPGMSVSAFPGTYRLGIANAQNDAAGPANTGPNAVVPLDLAPGIDYQVVFFVDLVNLYSGMAINPASAADVLANSPGGVSSGAATDTFTPKIPMAGFGLRQRQGEGIMQLDNLEVSFDWNGAGSGYGVVTGGVTAAKAVIGLQPLGTTNFTGNPYVMEVAASGIGTAGTGMTYAWYQNGVKLADGGSVTGSATPALTLNSLVATNSGTYYVTVTGAAGGAAQSSNAIVSVNTTPTAPVFSVQPAANTTNSQGGSVTFTSLAAGTGPITYEWFFNNGVNNSDTGSSGSTLTLKSLGTNQSGTYTVVATGGTGLSTTSSPAVLTVTGPKSTTIGYLRSLLNPTTFQPSDTTGLYSVTGVITTATNLTSGNTASYYLQDSTGGINLFVTFGSDFRPQLADVVTATGVLSSFTDNYELDVSEGSSGYVDTILSHNAPLPTPIVLPWGNNPGPLSPSLSTNVEGSVVMITNLYFAAYTNGAVFAAGGNYIITNTSGQSYTVFVSAQDTSYVTGQPMPPFAYSISGPLFQNTLSIGIEFTVYSNLVTTPSSTVTIGTIGGAVSGAGGTNFTLSWTAVPNTATYSIRTATNVALPFTNVIATGLKFSTTAGTYTDVGPTNKAKFYQITSP